MDLYTNSKVEINPSKSVNELLLSISYLLEFEEKERQNPQ
jgi:ribosomal protein L30/L7E